MHKIDKLRGNYDKYHDSNKCPPIIMINTMKMKMRMKETLMSRKN